MFIFYSTLETVEIKIMENFYDQLQDILKNNKKNDYTVTSFKANNLLGGGRQL
jgi:hypothetical protein